VSEILWILSKLDLRSVIDIILVSGVIYGILLLVRGTQAVQLLRGAMLVALAVALVGSVARLTAFNWLLRNGGQVLAVVLAVVLQPELRRALDRLGRASTMGWGQGGQATLERAIIEIAAACVRMAEQKHGALIVIERETGLREHVETGVEIDAKVSSELLQTIFFPSTALHDGAVIIRGGRIISAACVLPLSETIVSDGHLGTRHRAAAGITEQTDALSIVVSEETGVISMARGGRIVRHLDERRLVTLMRSLLTTRRGQSRRRRREPKAAAERTADAKPEARRE